MLFVLLVGCCPWCVDLLFGVCYVMVGDLVDVLFVAVCLLFVCCRW